MKNNSKAFLSLFAAMLLCLPGCDGKDPDNPGDEPQPKPKENVDGYVREIEQADDDFNYRQPSGAEIIYTPSLVKNRKYKPIDIQSYHGSAPAGSAPGSWTPSWTTEKARIVHYMSGYEPAFKTYEKYSKWTNKWGSTKTKDKREATGRFRTEKIDGRWWIIDPMGYLHYERSVTSFRYGSSARNTAAWNTKYGSDDKWISETAAELAHNGFHGTGAFCTNTYTKVVSYNSSHSLAPLTLAPSFGFLSAFKSASGHKTDAENSYPIALVLEDDWPSWCKTYMAGSAFEPYRKNMHVLGFFSDNEINFSSSSVKLLKAFLDLKDNAEKAKAFAVSFMTGKGLSASSSAVTDDLNSEFCGLLAEKYYKAVKEARDAADPGLMYLGSRLHGTPKYLKGVVQAAGKYCDIVSINYYSRWSPELDTYVKNWEEWAGKPFLVTEFYVKGILDSDLNNQSGAGWCVPRQEDRAYWYQHFTLGLLEAKNCVGWHWFKYQDDDGTDNSSQPANKGLYDNSYNIYPTLARFAREINFNAYDLIDYFDGKL